MTFDPIECSAKVKRLTPRQRELLGHLSNGRMVKEIAPLMNLSENTVENYCSMIYRTLGVGNKVEAARVAMASGMTLAN